MYLKSTGQKVFILPRTNGSTYGHDYRLIMRPFVGAEGRRSGKLSEATVVRRDSLTDKL